MDLLTMANEHQKSRGWCSSCFRVHIQISNPLYVDLLKEIVKAPKLIRGVSGSLIFIHSIQIALANLHCSHEVIDVHGLFLGKVHECQWIPATAKERTFQALCMDPVEALDMPAETRKEEYSKVQAATVNLHLQPQY